MNLLSLLPANLSFKNTKLKDAPLLLYDNLKFSNATEAAIPVTGRELSLQIKRDAGFTIKIFKKEEEFDDAQETSWLSNEELQKILRNHSFVSYSIYGKVKSNGSLSVSDILGFDIGASQAVELSQLTTHNKEMTIDEALITDLTDYKNLLTQSGDSSFWDTLKPNDALTYSLIGNLGFEVSVNILKLLSVAFAPVFALTKSGPKVPLKINPSAQIRFKAIKNDSFKILIAKKMDGNFRLSLNKNRQKEHTIHVSGELSVHLPDADEEKISRIINTHFEEYLGKPLNQIEEVLREAKEIRENSFLIRLAERIAFKEDTLEQLTEHFHTYRDKIISARQKVLDIVSASIKAGIEYEYRKLRENRVVLEAIVSKDILTSELKNLIALNIDNLIAKARKNEAGITIESYLQEKKLTIEERFSFGISVGNMALKSASKQIYQYDEKNIGLESNREVKLAFLDEKVVTFFGEEATVSASLDAETPTPATTLTYKGLEFNFTLTSKKSDRRIRPWDKKDLHQFLQTALVWNIFEEKELSKFFDSAWNNLLKNRDVEYECKLHIPPGIFPQTISALSQNASVEAISEAMAASILPNNSDKKSLLISARKEFYTPLIMDAFQGKDIMNSLEQPLFTNKYKEWKNYEIAQIQNQNMSGTDSFMSIANNRTFKHFQKLISGINLLNNQLQTQQILETNLEESVLKFFFKSFHSIVKDSSGFAQRWLGYYILESITKKQPDIQPSVVNTLTIIYPDDNNKKEALLIGG